MPTTHLPNTGAKTELGRHLQGLRLRAGLKQSEVADFLGTTRAMVGMYEIGRHVPKSERLETLLSFLSSKQPPADQ